ncbi:MAG: FecR domain-containing protein [Pseudomonadota bacterium]
MNEPDQAPHVREAAQIFLRLREDPENAALKAERDAFLARGAVERAAYEKLTRAWLAARKGRKRSNGRTMLLLMGIITGSLYLFSDTLRVYLQADNRTGLEARQITLASGDTADLDAGSAIADDTDAPTRHVTLLQGAAYFDVETDARRFVVEAGALVAEALGTEFAVSRADDAVFVSVSEGTVEVRAGSKVWTINTGQRLRWAEDSARITQIAPSDVAAWRRGQLVTDGMSFAEVVEILDRRISGEIVITDSALARSSVVGGLDLTRPDQALRTLAAVRGATITAIPPLVTFVQPGD